MPEREGPEVIDEYQFATRMDDLNSNAKGETAETMTITIERAVKVTPEIRALVGELNDTLGAVYADHQRHGLSIGQLFEPHVRFFVARLDGIAVGCGGIAVFDDYAEVKRMYTRPAVRGRGVAKAIYSCRCASGIRTDLVEY